MYKRLVFPLLQNWDPETTHERTIRLLEASQRLAIGRSLLRLLAGKLPDLRVKVLGLEFPNPIGIAAGYDKDCRAAAALGLLGFGHVEVGTITPQPQVGNERPRIFRLPEDRALINRLGFPNCGSGQAAKRLHDIKYHSPRLILGVSLGKQKKTLLEEAAADYLQVMRDVFPYADYFALNVSSPNTPGLRELQGPLYLDKLLMEVMAGSQLLADNFSSKIKPILIKISPDLSFSEVDDVLEYSLKHGIAGIIATNTTVQRKGLTAARGWESGGLSGLPLARRSNEMIRYIRKQVGDRLALVGVGGIFSAEDVRERVESGASLVQLYSGLVYEGPRIAGTILRSLAKSAAGA